MKLKALQDCLIVRPDVEKHELFFLLKHKKTGTGVVLFAGPRAVHVSPGDRILFGEFVGQEVTVDGETLLVMREEHIMGVYDHE